MNVAATTVVRPTDPALRQAVRLALLFAAVKLALHIATNLWQAHIGWGYFRDEFYYIACGRHLAWGFVDHGPLVAVQARLAETLFGPSLVGLRLLSAAGGALRVLLTGLLCWSLGGRRPAQALAMLAVLVAPQYLGTDGYLSMNSLESPFWMLCTLCLITGQRRLEQGDPVHQALRGPWILFGLSAGLGLLNKPSMTFFLLALLAALLLTPARRLLFNRYAALGVVLLVLIALPNVLWQIHNHWPTLEFLENGRAQGKNLVLSPVAFLAAQITAMHPANLVVWIPGLVSLLVGSLAARWRWLGLTFVFFLGGMMALHAKDYYCTPIYPILFAAGGIAWERRFAGRRLVREDRVLAFPVAQATLLVTGLLLLPMAIPVLRPAGWVTYTRALHLDANAGRSENTSSGVLPQFFADRFGWQEYVDIVARTYNALSPEDRARVLIFTNDYGEAGAIDALSRWQHLDLPPALCGQNSYWHWGTHGRDPDLGIAIIRDTPEEIARKYTSVTIVGHMSAPFAMPFEHRNVYLLRGRRTSAPFNWADERYYY